MQNELRNWSDVRVFLAVFREGSTLAASRKLGVAQPTVARRIEALEKEIGLTLTLSAMVVIAAVGALLTIVKGMRGEAAAA